MESEQHPYFSSGIWEGHYTYQAGPDAHRHPMSFHLDFRDGSISGSGSDDIGGFTWSGRYDTETMVVRMIKSYPSHQVAYDGRADQSGIYGSWILPLGNGGFHIWPRQNGSVEQAEEVTTAEKELILSTPA